MTVPAGLNNVAAIAAGSMHSLALKTDGTMIAWGVNNHDQTNRLEYKHSLADREWIALPLISGTGGVRKPSDAASGDTQRFYRVRQW
jgi:hypothetical protein